MELRIGGHEARGGNVRNLNVWQCGRERRRARPGCKGALVGPAGGETKFVGVAVRKSIAVGKKEIVMAVGGFLNEPRKRNRVRGTARQIEVRVVTVAPGQPVLFGWEV